MANCKNLKLKLNRKLECKLTGKIITWNQCKNCKLREFKINNKINAQSNVKTCEKNAKMHNKIRNTVQIRKRTSRLAKLERNRFSLFSSNTNKCYFCSNAADLTWHEIFRGKNRTNSMKYGLCLRICVSCHEKYQEDINFNDYWHEKGQLAFISSYPELDFLKIFGRNYL